MHEPSSAPLSFAQQRLWMVNALEPDSAAYNVRTAYRLRGPLDRVALEASLRAIGQRHEVLRTTFASHDGEPVALVSPDFDLVLPVFDLGSYRPGERDALARRQLEKTADAPFDLAAGPLARALLVRYEPDDHVLLIVFHHIVFDGGSVTPFNRELTALYAGFRRDAPPVLDELAIQYADFAVWQREAFAGFTAARDLTYWREALTGAPARIELPTDRARAAGKPRTGAIRSTHVPSETVERISALGRGHGATLFVTLLTAFNVLLYRYGGGHDLVVGTPIANRRRTELEPLIGFFVNTLPIRTQLRGTQAFDQLLRRTRENALAAFDHQDAPFERLVAELGGERRHDETALVNVLFFARTDPDTEFELEGVAVERYPLASTRAKFDLSFRYAEEPHGLTCTVQYDTQLFDAATMDRFLSHFRDLLAAIVDAPSAPIATLPLGTIAERDALAGAADKNAVVGAKHSLRERFESIAARTPDAVAVVCGPTTLQYAQLNADADTLAHELRARGVAREEIVAVALPRSPAAIVAMLAVLKAGGAYLPLDPEYPSDPLRFMLADSGARIVITDRTTNDRFADLTTQACLNIDALESRPQIPADAPAADADDLAYIMYTSGSTGRPKGVLIEQSAIDNLVTSTPAIAIEPSDAVAQMANLSFDAATYEIWGALLNGARLEIVPREIILAATDLADFLRARAITVAFVTSALFHTVSRLAPSAFTPLRCLITGGDVLDPTAVRAILAGGAPRVLLNAYGPTETTTFATIFEITQPPYESIPIGRPLAGTQAYILDADGSAVPIGVRGQLHIGGSGLARGYLNDPAATRRGFIRHPFAVDPAERLYATGDVARYTSDGNIAFLGRRDRQVKRRGFRIELDEIEAALKALADVTDAAVVIHTDGPGEKRIVAYVVASEADVRRALAQRLPAYMLPDTLVNVPAIPVSANGKIDLRALADSIDQLAREPSGDAPSAPDEVVIAEIFASLLGLARVGRSDDFFTIGGHSLLAARVIARIGDRFDVEMSLREFFAGPTVAELAQRIARAPRRGTPVIRIPVDPLIAELSDEQVAALLEETLRG